jgi:hypothetical protein
VNHNAPALGYTFEGGVEEIDAPADTLRATAPPDGCDATVPDQSFPFSPEHDA